jgi:hypothetical protein
MTDEEYTCDPGYCQILELYDRIKALTAKVKLMDDLDVINVEKIEALTAKNEMLGREVNIARYGQPNFAWSVHVQVMDDLNAKLAKAVEGLREIRGNGDATGRNPQLMANIARATLAEIEGAKG